MRIKDLIEELSQFDQETELVVNVGGEYVSPKMKRDCVMFKHNYNGVAYRDNAVVLS